MPESHFFVQIDTTFYRMQTRSHQRFQPFDPLFNRTLLSRLFFQISIYFFQRQRQLAVELAPHNITVNAIAPGFFATELNSALIENKEFNDWVCERTPAGRWGALNEIGPPAVFLASDEASYVNGHVLTVDGAMSVAM